MQPTSIPGVFAGYDLMSCYKWGGIYTVWTLDEFSSIYLSMKESGLARRQRKPHKFKAIDFLDGDIVFPLRSEFDRVNYTLEGAKARGTSSV
ncbi:MAG: hypothetical protein ACKO96_27925, partial [Flammeovirgaceae bacterium]